MIKVIVVEDEQNLGQELKKMIESYHEDVRVVAVCSDLEEAEKAFIEFRPDLVFLDVELEKGKTSFHLLKKFSYMNFGVIFVTGFNSYALQAIKFSVVDYLLKPIDEDELKAAIDKFKTVTFKVDINRVENFLTVWANPSSQQNKIPLPTMAGYDLITISDILYCEGLSNQTLFVLDNKKEIIISMTLKECADALQSYNFFRIHKSYLINMNHVRKYVKKDDGIVIMTNGSNLAVSRSFKDKFIEQLKSR